MYAKWFTWILLILPLIFPACTRNSRPIEPPTLTQTDKMIITTLRQRSAAFRALRTPLKMQIEVDNQRNSFNAALIYREPDHLRMDIFGPLGILGAIVAVVGDSVTVYIPHENALLQTSVESGDLERILGVNVSVSDLLSLMDGGLQFLRQDILSSNVRVDGIYYLLTVSTNNGLIYYWLDPSTLNPVEIQHLDLKKSLKFRVVLEEYHQIHTLWRADKMLIERPNVGEKLQIQFRDQELNPTLNDEEFVFRIPENVKQIQFIDE